MTLLRSRVLESLGVLHAFPERDARDEELVAALGLAPATVVVQVKQVHGGDVIEAAGSTGREADGLVARAAPGVFAAPGGLAASGAAGPGAPGPVAVGVRVADCVPVLLADEVTGDVAAVHAGWRGVTRGVVGAGVARLVGTRDPRRLVAAIGPCIGPCCFEVGADVAAIIAAASNGARVIASERGDKAYVDLRAAVRARLIAAGLDDARVDDVGGCTKHEAARFHSFRRDGANSGRMLACIAARRARMIP